MAHFNWDKHVAPILNTVDKSDGEKLSELCSRLWTVLQSNNVIGRSKGKHRSSVLRSMFQLLNCKDSRLLLKAAKIKLAVSYCSYMYNLCTTVRGARDFSQCLIFINWLHANNFSL